MLLRINLHSEVPNVGVCSRKAEVEYRVGYRNNWV